ncbi:hypothetical protein [Methylomonas sp. AM2-LC]|uniref:hypothetical protein n=1 Tax=Methylomonas sp. AM2-LC TaxID=3153301 RepID=UPI0032636436
MSTASGVSNAGTNNAGAAGSGASEAGAGGTGVGTGEAATGTTTGTAAATGAGAGTGSGAANATGTESGAVGSGNAGADASGTDASGSGGATGGIEYTDFSIPDGLTINADLLGEFTTAAKTYNLTQEQAQALADLGVKQAQSILKQVEDNKIAETLARDTAWLNASQSDPEIGGEKLQENVALAIKARDQLATPEFSKYLEDTGLGNHPEMIRMLAKVGKQLGEDGFLPGGSAGGSHEEPTIAERMFPNAPKK